MLKTSSSHLPWSMLPAVVIAGTVFIPIGVLFSSWFESQPDIWEHLSLYVLPELLSNTFWLVLGVGVLAGVFGITCAGLVALTEFPGRRFFGWSLLLPMAMPSYVLAFVIVGLLDFAGPLQSFMRTLGVNMAWLSIRGRGGVILVMGLALYPYVYLLVQKAFATQGQLILESAQSLGMNRWRSLWYAALPMARPAIASGVLLVMVETLADFGTVSAFNYDTLTTAIYKSWFGLFSLPVAAQLASLLLLFVLSLMWLEQLSRIQMNHHSVGHTTRSPERSPPIHLTGWQGYLASAWCLGILSLAFIIPMIQLGIWSWQVLGKELNSHYWSFVWHSVLLSGLGALWVVIVGLVLLFSVHQSQRWMKTNYAGFTRYFFRLFLQGSRNLATAGYILPGPVLAVGIFISVAWLEGQLLFSASWFDESIVLRGSIIVLIIGYGIRFLAVAYAPLESAWMRLRTSWEEVGYTLGYRWISLLRTLYLPLLKGGLSSALLFCFVELMKEMPITLMMRPFGWDTLAVWVFQMTSEGEWQRAALPSIAIVLVGLLPVWLLSLDGQDTLSRTKPYTAGEPKPEGRGA